MTRHCHVLYADPDAVTAVWNGLGRPADPAAPKRREEEEAAVAVGKEVEVRGRRPEREERSAL
jgi:hypothetical protein